MDFLFLCRTFVTFEPPPTPKPALQKILQIYASMTHGVTLKALCCRMSPKDNNIDERYSMLTFDFMNRNLKFFFFQEISDVWIAT